METTRRSFLKFLGAAVVVPKIAVDVLSKIPVPKDPLFTGALGEYYGVRLHRSPTIRQAWSDSLYVQATQKEYFSKFSEGKNALIITREYNG